MFIFNLHLLHQECTIFKIFWRLVSVSARRIVSSAYRRVSTLTSPNLMPKAACLISTTRLYRWPTAREKPCPPVLHQMGLETDWPTLVIWYWEGHNLWSQAFWKLTSMYYCRYRIFVVNTSCSFWYKSHFVHLTTNQVFPSNNTVAY